MALGPTELTFLISSGIILALFIIVFYKLCKNSDVRRSHKIVYAIIFPGIVVLGCVSIFVFNLFMDWREVLMFNVVWVPLFLLMLLDLNENPIMRNFPFGRLFLAVGLVVISVILILLITVDFFMFMSTGEWVDFLPLPIFIVLVLLIGPILILTTRTYGKGEETSTEGKITSGGRAILLILGFGFAILIMIIGIMPLISEDSWVPLQIGILTLIVGIILFIYINIQLNQERHKRL